MPSGPPELHEEWCNRSPTGDGDFEAMRYLRKRGYKLTDKWFWVAPSRYHTPSAKENSAINYLMWEWDFGGVETEEKYYEN